MTAREKLTQTDKRFIPLLETHSSIKTPRTCSGPGARQWLHSSRLRREAEVPQRVHEPSFAQTPQHRCLPRGEESAFRSRGSGRRRARSRLQPPPAAGLRLAGPLPCPAGSSASPGLAPPGPGGRPRSPPRGPAPLQPCRGSPRGLRALPPREWRGDAVTFALAQDAAAEALQQNVGGFLVRSRHRRGGGRRWRGSGRQSRSTAEGGGGRGRAARSAAQGAGGTSRSRRRLRRHFNGTRRKPQPRAHNAPRAGAPRAAVPGHARPRAQGPGGNREREWGIAVLGIASPLPSEPPERIPESTHSLQHTSANQGGGWRPAQASTGWSGKTLDGGLTEDFGCGIEGCRVILLPK